MISDNGKVVYYENETATMFFLKKPFLVQHTHTHTNTNTQTHTREREERKLHILVPVFQKMNTSISKVGHTLLALQSAEIK